MAEMSMPEETRGGGGLRPPPHSVSFAFGIVELLQDFPGFVCLLIFGYFWVWGWNLIEISCISATKTKGGGGLRLPPPSVSFVFGIGELFHEPRNNLGDVPVPPK